MKNSQFLFLKKCILNLLIGFSFISNSFSQVVINAKPKRILKSVILNRCCLLIIFIVIQLSSLGQQTFNATISSPPVDLTGANGSCATPGAGSPNVFTFTVSGVGVMSSTNTLINITTRFANCGGSYNLNLVSFRIIAPNGTCVGVYDGGLGNSYSGITEFGLVSSTSCLNQPNTSNLPSTATASGFNSSSNSGVFSADWGGVGVDFATTFNGIDANGIWKIVFSESTVSEPCLQSALLSFGNPTVDDQTGNGNSCITPIVWDGGPICASTNSMTSSSQMPGWAGPGASTFGTFNGGVTCNWNGANNNDVWLQFTAQTTNVCINLSGLDNNQQSVVVSDPNTDGDNNPCTGANGGQYWSLISCPNPSSYTTTAGTTVNQNHCFTAVVGQTYYMVVDGNGGAESPFYVSGISGTSYNLITLPIELISFEARLNNRQVDLTWQTATEHNNDYFSVERSHDGTSWETIENLQGAGNSTSLLSYQTYDFYPYRGIGYYRLKQVDYDGKTTFSEIQRVYKTDELMILPNPSSGFFGIGGMPKHQENNISVLDITGKDLEHYTTEDESYQLDLTHRTAGIYFVIINGFESIKIIKN